jgi:ubiquinone/menaquinone biosynthesis C-methylase UbiE
MSRDKDSQSPKPAEVAGHYSSGYEAGRLSKGAGILDRERSRELLKRFLPPSPAVILDVGGGPGGHAFWLAEQGYRVHLIDITPLHVQMASAASQNQPETPLASAQVGDACALPWKDGTADAVLLFGPLYHLTDQKDRIIALREAYRVLKAGGVLLAAGISRFASMFDGLRQGFLKDPYFAEIVAQDLQNGQHRNPARQPEYFTDTFFHHPCELRQEIAQAGFEAISVFGVEGPGWLLLDIEAWWGNPDYQARLLQIARTVEAEESLLGVSAHLMAMAKKEIIK